MKKIIVFLLITALLLTAAACGESKDSGKTPSDDGETSSVSNSSSKDKGETSTKQKSSDSSGSSQPKPEEADADQSGYQVFKLIFPIDGVSDDYDNCTGYSIEDGRGTYLRLLEYDYQSNYVDVEAYEGYTLDEIKDEAYLPEELHEEDVDDFDVTPYETPNGLTFYEIDGPHNEYIYVDDTAGYCINTTKDILDKIIAADKNEKFDLSNKIGDMTYTQPRSYLDETEKLDYDTNFIKGSYQGTTYLFSSYAVYNNGEEVGSLTFIMGEDYNELGDSFDLSFTLEEADTKTIYGNEYYVDPDPDEDGDADLVYEHKGKYYVIRSMKMDPDKLDSFLHSVKFN